MKLLNTPFYIQAQKHSNHYRYTYIQSSSPPYLFDYNYKIENTHKELMFMRSSREKNMHTMLLDKS